MLDSLIDTAVEQFRTDQPSVEPPSVAFLEQVKRHCAALPCPLGVTVYARLIILRYRHKFTVERRVLPEFQYDAAAPSADYILCIVNSHGVGYTLPTQCEELAKALP